MELIVGVLAILSFPIALIFLWPRVKVSLNPETDTLIWEFTIDNDSFLAIADLRATCEMIDIRLPGFSISNSTAELGGATARRVPPGTQHTVNATAIGGNVGSPVDGSRLALRVAYRYLGVPVTKRACFEVSARRGAPKWLPVACN